MTSPVRSWIYWWQWRKRGGPKSAKKGSVIYGRSIRHISHKNKKTQTWRLFSPSPSAEVEENQKIKSHCGISPLFATNWNCVLSGINSSQKTTRAALCQQKLQKNKSLAKVDYTKVLLCHVNSTVKLAGGRQSRHYAKVVNKKKNMNFSSCTLSSQAWKFRFNSPRHMNFKKWHRFILRNTIKRQAPVLSNIPLFFMFNEGKKTFNIS